MADQDQSYDLDEPDDKPPPPPQAPPPVKPLPRLVRFSQPDEGAPASLPPRVQPKPEPKPKSKPKPAKKPARREPVGREGERA